MDRIRGVNKVTAKLAGGRTATYFYHRATGARLEGRPGSAEFIASLAAAMSKAPDRSPGTLSGLIRKFAEHDEMMARLAAAVEEGRNREFRAEVNPDELAALRAVSALNDIRNGA